MTETVYKLENFDTPLDNSRMLFLLGRSAQPPKLLDELINCPRLVSRVLIASTRSEVPLLFKGAWSAVFSPADGKDWQLVLTYCLHMTKPGIIVVQDGVALPEGFIGRLPFTQGQAQGLQLAICWQICQPVPATTLASADAVFLPLVEDLAGADADACLAVLKGQLGVGGGPLEQKKEWLREVRSVKAALVWTRIRERGAGGAVYWFDPADGADGAKHMNGRTVRKMLGALGELL
jgi:hypothetical protein